MNGRKGLQKVRKLMLRKEARGMFYEKSLVKKVISLFLVVLLLTPSLPIFAISDENKEKLKIVQDINETIEKIDIAISRGEDVKLTKEEAYNLLQYGGEEGIKTIEKIGKPVSMPTYTEEQIEYYKEQWKRNREQGVPLQAVRYNMKTGEETIIDYGTIEDNERDQHVKLNPSDGTSIQRDYPRDWYTPNPEDYEDTRSTCKLFIYIEELQTCFYGSGWLLAGDEVVTAGHCIYSDSHGNQRWPTFIKVIPSFSEATPNGKYGILSDGSVEVGREWANGWNIEDDWGMIHLTDSFPAGVGYYTPIVMSDDNLFNGWARTEGYDGIPTSGTIVQNDLHNLGGVIYNIEDRLLYASTPFISGMSGGPCMQSGRYVMGIIQGIKTPGDDYTMVRITDELFEHFMSYR